MEELQQATRATEGENGELIPITGVLPVDMKHSDGSALPLLIYKHFGADVIRFAAGEGVGTHTHEGDHILLVLSGTGWVEYYGIDYELKPGVSYMVPGSVPHAIKAKSELVLMAIANNHRHAGSEERLDVVK